MTKVIPIESAGGTLCDSVAENAGLRERRITRLLVTYISAGLAFMLLPGTFLGVWNLFAISSQRAAHGVADVWIQAHGHAQVFGWIGCFILGIGFHSIPKMRGEGRRFAIAPAWVSFALWTTGVSLRWLANVYLWQWRILLPASAVLELAAFLIFFRAVSRHKPRTQDGAQKAKFDPWIFVVIAGTLGLLATLLLNLWESLRLALHGTGPAFPPEFDHRFLTVMAWGFIVPHIWGFSAKWLPTFLGLRASRPRLLLVAVGINVLGVVLGATGQVLFATWALLCGVVLAGFALRIFVRPERPAKINGVHRSFPIFVRIAYAWMHIAAGLAVWAALRPEMAGMWGASRHALTVGFISLMVFCIGQRVLPAFGGMKVLWSTNLMFAGCALLTLGCAMRVASEVVAYQGTASSMWSVLPVSAVIEMSAVTMFAINLIVTFVQRPAHEIRLEGERAGIAGAQQAVNLRRSR